MDSFLSEIPHVLKVLQLWIMPGQNSKAEGGIVFLADKYLSRLSAPDDYAVSDRLGSEKQ